MWHSCKVCDYGIWSKVIFTESLIFCTLDCFWVKGRRQWGCGPLRRMCGRAGEIRPLLWRRRHAEVRENSICDPCDVASAIEASSCRGVEI